VVAKVGSKGQWHGGEGKAWRRMFGDEDAVAEVV